MKSMKRSLIIIISLTVFLLSCNEKSNNLPTIVLKTKLAKGDTIAFTIVLDNNITDSVSIDFGSGIRKTFFPSLRSTGLQVQSGNSVTEIKFWGTFRQPIEDSIIKIYAPANAIVQLGCGLNKISSIDLSNCKALKKLNISNNLLEQLDLTSNFTLEALNCSKNKLSKLNLDRNLNLTDLFCTDNSLAELDLTKLQNLESIQCQNNLIKEIRIPDQNRIFSLNCSNNYLYHLNTQKCEQLKDLNCANNYLTKLQFFSINNIEHLQCNNNCIAPDSIPYFYNRSNYYLPQDCNVLGYAQKQAERFNQTPQESIVAESLFIPTIITDTQYDQKSDMLTINFRCFHSIQIPLRGRKPIDYSKDNIKVKDVLFYLAKDGRVQIRSCYFNEIRYLAKDTSI